jgi:peptidyl-prolyl cis-trans isomerase SurA
MMAFRFIQSSAILILSGALGSVPSLAQTTNPKASAAAAATPPPSGKVVEDIVARVNDQIVTQSDYDRAAEQLEAEARQQSVPAQQVEQKKADLLRDLIDQQLLLSKGKELGITGETELIKRLDEIRKQNHLDSLEDLEKAAQQQGVSYEDFKASIRNGIITQEVVRDEVGRHLSLSPGDAERYFKAHESEFAQPESVTLNEILVPTSAKAATEGTDAPDVAAAKSQADAITAKLAGGAKFEDLAKPSPADANAPKLVALGDFHRGQLGAGIEDKAFALKAGQYTEPIRTKQGFIILQATEHYAGGDASFKQVEPQVEEALFMEKMQPALRQYLTKLREEAYVELKPGVVDTGSSGNEMRLTYSAYAPPPEKKKKKFVRTRFRGRKSSPPAQTTQTASTAPAAAGAAPTGSNPAAAPATPAPAPAGVNALAPTPGAPSAASTNTPPAATQAASNNSQGVEKPGKKEKIRFGQAPRESLPANSQVASAATPDNTPGVTTPETRYVNPDGTVSGAANAAAEKKTRLASRPIVKKPKTPKSDADTDNQPTSDELANQKVQNAPLGLAPDPASQKKTKPKGDKTRIEERPKEPDQTPAPYLGKPESGATAPATTGQPGGHPAAVPSAPAGSTAPAPSAPPPGAPTAQPPASPQP